jgi:hypothetical protein
MPFTIVHNARTIRAITLVILCLGFVLRAQQYLFNRSLWMDEAMLALNIVDRSFTGLIQPLEYSQGAPLGFLFIQKLAVTLLGNHDYILRLFPFIASLISLILFYHLAHATTKGLGRILATYLFSVSTWLVYYASECKQYSSDVMACLLLLLCGQRCLRAEATTKDIIILTLAGIIALWLSHPALFICCGVELALIIDCFKRGKPGILGRLLMMTGFWTVNFLVLYAVSFSRLSANNVLMSYWNEFFMPLPPWQNLAWFSTTLTRVLVMPIGLAIPWLGALLITAGLATYLFKKRLMGVLLLTPLLITLLASGLKKYPFGDRLLLFTLPIFFLCIGQALDQLRTMVERKHAIGAIILSMAVIVSLANGPTAQAIANVRHPRNDEDIKSVLEYVAQKKTNQDALYVYYSTIPAFSFYAPRFGLAHHTIVRGIGARDNPVAYMNDVAQVRGNQRVWFIFSHNYNWGSFDEVAFYYDYILPRMGEKLDEFRSDNASAFLYSMR